MTITRRPETPEDEPFLRRLILGTISEELGADRWPEAVRHHLLEIQYRARRQAGRSSRPEVESQVIQADGRDCGWLVVTTLPEEVRLIEVMILADFRGRGAGTSVIREVLQAAGAAGKSVRLHVNVTNLGAVRLYERLGFRKADGDEVQDFMEWRTGCVSASLR